MNDVISKLDHENTNDALFDASQKLVPWLNQYPTGILSEKTESNLHSSLDSFYLFPVEEVSVRAGCEDIPAFITERFQNLLTAAAQSNISVALVLSRRNGVSRVFIGLRDEEGTHTDPKVLESILNGFFPGRAIHLDQTVNFSKLTKDFKWGGLVSGISSHEREKEDPYFNISSVVRSLYDREFLLSIISKPVSEQEKTTALMELMELRDQLHSLSHQTVGRDESQSISTAKTKTRTHSGSVILYSYSRTNSETENITTSSSRSLSVEEQNSYAIEFEKIANHHIENIIKGFGVGYWETYISYATENKAAGDILTGTLTGELSRGSDILLPPPQVYSDFLDDKLLFVPKTESGDNLFPKSLASYLPSDALSLVSSLPIEPTLGYEITEMPTLGMNDIGSHSGIPLGYISDHGNPIQGQNIFLSKRDLNKHLFVCGLTGSGKTTTIKHILKGLTEEDVPFLVLESAKRDYRQLLANDEFKDNLDIITVGNATISPIRINPFYIQEGVHPLEHIDNLKAIFNASFSLYGPMPNIMEKCLHTIYQNKGWDLTRGTHPDYIDGAGEIDERRYILDEHYYWFPTISDLKAEVSRYIESELDYKGEISDNIRTAIIVRLEGLCVGAKGMMFNTYDFYSIQKLLSRNTILEMESLADDDDKAFFVGLMLALISEYRQKENPAVNPGSAKTGLKHFMVIEEAHRLLKNVETERTTEMMGNPKGKAVEVFCNILSEMRSLGQGVAVVEQIPSKLAPDVIKNSNTKIVHRLVARDDQSLLAGSLSISDDDALYLNRLQTGHALCHKEGMGRPVECRIISDVKSIAVSDIRVKSLNKHHEIDNLHSYTAYELDEALGHHGTEVSIQLLNSLIISQDKTEDLVSNACKQLQALRTGSRDIVKQKDWSDYWTHKVMRLLTSGVFIATHSLPNTLRKSIKNVFEVPSDRNRDKLIVDLTRIWDTSDTRDYVVKVVSNLVLQNLRRRNLEIVDENIVYVLSSFFLVAETSSVIEITKSVKQKAGV